MNPGKVWMTFDDGTSGYVPQGKVQDALKDGGSVRMKVDVPSGPIVRTFRKYIPERWMQTGEFMAPNDSTKNTPTMAALGHNFSDAVTGLPEQALQMAPMMFPEIKAMQGAGQALPMALRAANAGARIAGGYPLNVAGRLATQTLRGQAPDMSDANAHAMTSALWQLPFELAGTMLPSAAPSMAATSVRPTPSQQRAAQQVEARQAGVQRNEAPPDYKRLGQQMIDENVPTGARGERTLNARKTADTKATDAARAQADQQGWQRVRTQIVRSPEILALKQELAQGRTGPEDIAYVNQQLKQWMRAGSTGGTPAQQSSVVGADGQPMTIPGTPAKQTPMGAEEMQVKMKNARDTSKPVLDARKRGETGGRTALDARIDDALARAMKAHLANIPLVGQPGTIGDANARIEARVPLHNALSDFQERVPPTAMERIMRLGYHPGLESRAALWFGNQGFPQQMAAAPRMTYPFLMPPPQSDDSQRP